MTTKSKAAEIIAVFEGKENEAYKDIGGIWTIGYGNTWHLDQNRPVKEGEKIDDQTALRWLKQSVGSFQSQVKSLVKVPINTNQLDSLTSLAYNIGITAFQNSTLLKMLNSNQPKLAVADQFLRWNKVKGVVSNGLIKRRQKERVLFLK